ncbi:MAG: glycosyltransferase family 25 protein [Akkermansiaceae bacterium]|nr:glycosyltransferase family 25 protein [Akkermansiaceae bacterium]
MPDPLRIACYCINLPASTDRRAALEKRAAAQGLAVRFVEGVEGTEADPATFGVKISEGTWAYRGYRLPPGQFGILLSHRRALDAFLADASASHAVILEDDAIPCDGLVERLHSLVRLVDGWDVIRIESRHRLNPWLTRAELPTGEKVVVSWKGDTGATANLYTREGARKVRATLDHLVLPYDVHLATARCWNLRVAEVQPPLVREDQVPSTNTRGPDPNRRHRRRTIFRLIGQSSWALYRRARALVTYLGLRIGKDPGHPPAAVG